MSELSCWWTNDREWFCILVRDATGEATVSLTPLQARQLCGRIAAYTPGVSTFYPPSAGEPELK